MRGRFQYSGGVSAEPGYVIERARFARPVPLDEGFRRIESYLDALARPPAAFCACELRSPGQFTEEGLRGLQSGLREHARTVGHLQGTRTIPSRGQTCVPRCILRPNPSFHAFSYTVPAGAGDAARPKSFVIAGSGEAPEGPGGYGDRIIRLGDTSPDAMREKARYVLGALELRMASLGVAWADATTSQVYSVHEIHGFLADEVVRRGAAPDGVTWTYARPPVQGLEFEMDVRSVPVERVIG